jgi:hypothetical protein
MKNFLRFPRKKDRGKVPSLHIELPQQLLQQKKFYCDVDANAFSSPIFVITFHIRKLPSQRHKK